MTPMTPPPAGITGLVRLDLTTAEARSHLTQITQDYFDWMNGEIIRSCNLSIPELVGMSIEAYVRHTTEIACGIEPADGGIYCHKDPGGQIMAMGGLRRLPDGAAEIVRIFTRPAFRGQGLGSLTIAHLVGTARLLGYDTLRLDTAVFMTSAQAIYRAAGFSLREPYAGAEPPPRLLPFWLFMERSV